MSGATVEYKFDALKRLTAALQDAPREFRKLSRRALTEAGRDTEQRAISNASFSSRIPSSISLQVSFRSSRPRIILRASLAKAPHARVMEGITAQGGMFEHPVFGNKREWVKQKARPYMAPAVRDTRIELNDKIEKVADDMIAKIASST
ncbi:hypothetical protein GCM10010401_14220 [Rarobacter faecitabidus]|uniref:HK97 gp10 family phage protein n=1 Tax=Rarobacter faecitabidus TaxID=13243 RepID=A0A542ZE00_RARFA|nr:HK97 gp10 family phage protein [Rarobacter faecitabidus]TQL58531.1 hypothetical protein FB461_1946 [Rarobacter faecitabidus]